MNELEAILLDIIGLRAEREAGRLARELVRAQAKDKEATLAALEFELWLAESCRDFPGEGGRSSQAQP